ncbi:TPA: hypothetical protein RRH99_005064 [Klebsiella pneumoniae]|nr:hypothetical protein [Klebsiella pneumoniae]
MTDITELAQREKFEAWAEERCALPWGYLKNRRTNTGYFSKHDYTSLWAAWKAADAGLVEALEKAQGMEAYWKTQCRGITDHCEELQQRISELEPIRAAAEKLVRCKGRYHSEQNYRALAALFGVNTPDLPPMDGEPVAWQIHTPEIGVTYVETKKQSVENIRNGFGIKVEITPLYRHAQQPVVPDAYVRDEHGRMMLNGVCEPKIGFGAGWNACRAAMLQAGNSPVIPEGYVMVPKEPTERMVIDGFESEPDETFSESEVWEAYQKMSGCEQAAFRARLCWAAMLAAVPPVPTQENI